LVKRTMGFPEVLKLPKKLEVTSVRADPRETALVIIDVQNDFINPSGKLYAKGSEKIIPPIKKLLSKARDAGATILFTQDWHIRDDPEFKIWGEHTVAGTWGAEIIGELKPEETDITIRKPSYDAFYSTPLDHVLKSREIKKLILTGLLGNICVLCTAVGAAVRGYELIIPVDAVFSLTDFDHIASLRFMNSVLKAALTSSDLLSFEVREK